MTTVLRDIGKMGQFMGKKKYKENTEVNDIKIYPNLYRQDTDERQLNNLIGIN